MRLRPILALLAGAVLAQPFAAPHHARAAGIVDPSVAPYEADFKGKTVAFLPISMGFDLTQEWGGVMKQQADKLGYKFEIRDPNWSTDKGAQALTQLIAEKPDVIVVQNPDIQSYARLLKKAEQAGIYVLQINMKSAYPTEVYAGSDYNAIGADAANLIVNKCSPKNGGSGKISIVQGVLTGGASVYQIEGISKVLAEHPEIKVVSNQAADWDASKAHDITQTVLEQNPDLCGVIGFWDGMDIGVGAAIREAGKAGKVFVITSGGGAQSACDNIKKGTFDAYYNYDAQGQGRDLNDGIRFLLQSKPKPGTTKVMLYSKITMLDKANLEPGSCWIKTALSN